MFTGSVLNEAVLDASIIMQGKDVLRDLIAKKTIEWNPSIQLPCQPSFKAVMERFALASETIPVQGDPEQMVELVEQFRAYLPLKTETELLNFLTLRRRFSLHIHLSLLDAKASPPELKEETALFVGKATTYTAKAAEAGAFFDQVKLAKLTDAWNVITEEFTQVVKKHASK